MVAPDPETDGASNAAGMGGMAGAAAVGAPGAAGRQDGPACTEYDNASTVADSCALVLDECPATLGEYASYLQMEGRLDRYVAEVGCGLVVMVDNQGLTGDGKTFDENGDLVGYFSWQEYDWGPCPASRSSYGFGPDTYDCPALRTCAISANASQPGDVCACACPAEPPPAGVYQGDATCAYEGTYECGTTLDQEKAWLKYSTQAVMKSGCRFTSTTEIRSDGETLECVYDGETWVGVRRVEAGTHRDCPGVDVWQSGSMYETCTAEVSCLLDPEDKATKTMTWCSGQVL